MAEQTSQPHQPPSTAEEQAATESAVPVVVEKVVESPLASADIEVQTFPAAEAVSVVEKTAPLSLAQPTPSVLAEEKVSITSSSTPLSAALAEPQEPGFIPQPVPPPGVEETRKGGPESCASFKEESNIVSDLTDSQRKALEELKSLVEEGINNNTFGVPLPQ